MIWHYVEKGYGRPLILLHGIGMNCNAWAPIIDRTFLQRRVIAFDIPGFGKTPALPDSIVPNSENMAESLRICLQEMGISEPVDIVGNSLGGRIALDAAAKGMARTVVGISPAGLWLHKGPPHIQHLFGAMRKGYAVVPTLTETALKNPIARSLLMAGAVSIQGWKMPSHEAIRATRIFAHSDKFEPIFNAFRPPFIHADKITVPCTIAFGDFDMVFPVGTRERTRVPAHTYWRRLPGCGHVPMWDNPDLVSHVILRGTR